MSAAGRGPGAVAVARVVNASFFIAVGSYCFLAYTPFAYFQFIKPNVLPALTDFVKLTPWLFLVTQLITLLTLMEALRGGRGAVAARTYVAATALLGVAMLFRAPLADIGNTRRAYVTGLLALAVPVWLSIVDHRIWPAAETRPADRSRALAACGMAALAVWAMYALALPWRLPRAIGITLGARDIAIGLISSLLSDLVVFMALFAAFAAVMVLARAVGRGGRFGLVGALEYLGLRGPAGGFRHPRRGAARRRIARLHRPRRVGRVGGARHCGRRHVGRRRARARARTDRWLLAPGPDSRFTRGVCRVRRRPRQANRRVVCPRGAAIRGLRHGGGSRAVRLELSDAEAERAGGVAGRFLRGLRGHRRSAPRSSPSVAAGGDASRGVRALRRARDRRTWCRARALRRDRSVVPTDSRRQDDALGGDRRVLCVPALADARAAAARPPGRHRFRQPAQAGRGPEAARVSARRRQHAARLRVGLQPGCDVHAGDGEARGRQLCLSARVHPLLGHGDVGAVDLGGRHDHPRRAAAGVRAAQHADEAG